MKRLFPCIAVVLCGWIPAAGDVSAAGFEPKPFDQLSEKSVSRRGAAALAMAAVDWEHGETDHFVLHTEKGFSAVQLAGAVETYYAAIKRDLGVEQDSFERKSHIYVFLGEDAWRSFIGATRLEPWTGGLCTGRELFMQARSHFKFQGSTLPHELTHLAVYRFVTGDMPAWLAEGFAEFEAVRLYRSYLKVRDYRLRNLSSRLEDAAYIPLRELTSAVDYPRDKDRVVAFYKESERLVSFLYHEHGGREPFAKFLNLQCRGLTFESALAQAYPGQYRGLAAFEEKFKKYAVE